MSVYDQMRADAQKVYRVSRESTELQGVSSENLELFRDLAIAHADQLEREAKADAGGCCGGCGGCMKRPSNLVNISEPK